MKKTLITLALVAACVPAFAQGKVSFGNDSLHYFSLGTDLAPGDTAGLIPISPLPSGRTLQATLYAGTTGTSLSLQTTIVLTGADWLTAGRMANKNVILVGVPGGAVANFQIVLSDTGAILPATIDNTGTLNRFAGTYYFGTSGAFTATPGGSLTYPGLISGGPANSTWAPATLSINGTVVPEPSSMVLAGLGAASLLLFRRRK